MDDARLVIFAFHIRLSLDYLVQSSDSFAPDDYTDAAAAVYGISV